jgi:hypothetical protein
MLGVRNLAEWLLDLQDKPLWETAILRAILEIQKSLQTVASSVRDQNGFCAVAKRR